MAIVSSEDGEIHNMTFLQSKLHPGASNGTGKPSVSKKTLDDLKKQASVKRQLKILDDRPFHGILFFLI